MRKSAARSLLLALILFLSIYTGQPLLSAAHAAIANTPIIAVDPTSQSGLTIGAGSTVTFKVNITNAPSIDAFTITLAYDYSILHIISFDSSSVLDSAGVVSTLLECVDELHIHIGNCQYTAGYIQVASFLTNLAVTSPTTNSTNGQLFKVTFQVQGQGFSQLHLVQALADTLPSGQPPPVPVLVRPVDGYFTNTDCPRGSGKLCTPPVPNFTVSPSVVGVNRVLQVIAGGPVLFNASSSRATSVGASLVRYIWDFGDGTTESSANVTTIHRYSVALSGRNDLFTITVTDSYGFSASKSVALKIILVWLELDINSVGADPATEVSPGTKVSITIVVKNSSTRSENASIAVRIQSDVFKQETFFNMTADLQIQLSLVWDTAGLRPDVYRIAASVDPVKDNSGRIIQNDTSNIIGTTYVQLIEALPQSFGIFFGLNFIQTLGVWTLLVGGAGFTLSLLRRKKPSIDRLP